MKKEYIQYFVFILLVCAAIYVIPVKISVILNSNGTLAYNRNDYPRAISLYERTIRIHPTAKTYYNLGCAYEKMGKEEQAIAAFEKGIELDSAYKPAYKALASLGEDTLTQGKDMKNTRIAALYNQGVRLYDTNRADKALDKFKQVIELDPLNFLAYKAAADIYSNQGKPDQALRYYKKALSLGLKDADAFNSMGIMCMRTEDYLSGVKYFRKALEMDADNPHYLYNLASTLRDSGQFHEAVSLYKKVIHKSPRYPNIHNDIAGIYSVLGLEDKARGEYQKAYDIAADLIKTGLADDFTFTRYAAACNGLNKTEEAEKILDDVIANNPDYYKAYYARAQVYNKQGKHVQANADYSRARELAKNIAISADQAALQAQRSEGKRPEGRKQEQPDTDWFKDESIVYLKNGHVVFGRIKKETDKKIVLEMKTGRTISTITFQKSKIEKIKKIKRIEDKD